MHKLHIISLPMEVIRATTTGDKGSWELNLATMSRDILYLLQDGVTQEFHAREGRTFHVMTEQKEKIEQITLQHDELAAQHREVEQGVTEACVVILELAIPEDLPLTTKI